MRARGIGAFVQWEKDHALRTCLTTGRRAPEDSSKVPELLLISYLSVRRGVLTGSLLRPYVVITTLYPVK